MDSTKYEPILVHIDQPHTLLRGLLWPCFYVKTVKKVLAYIYRTFSVPAVPSSSTGALCHEIISKFSLSATLSSPPL
jgi:hypothetical protein